MRIQPVPTWPPISQSFILAGRSDKLARRGVTSLESISSHLWKMLVSKLTAPTATTLTSSQLVEAHERYPGRPYASVLRVHVSGAKLFRSGDTRSHYRSGYLPARTIGRTPVAGIPQSSPEPTIEGNWHSGWHVAYCGSSVMFPTKWYNCAPGFGWCMLTP